MRSLQNHHSNCFSCEKFSLHSNSFTGAVFSLYSNSFTCAVFRVFTQNPLHEQNIESEMDSTQGEMAEARQPCGTPETLQPLQKAESEMESHEARLHEAAEQPCETPKTEKLLPLQSSNPNQEEILTEAGQPDLESNQDRVKKTGQPPATEMPLPLQSSNPNQEGVPTEAGQPELESNQDRVNETGQPPTTETPLPLQSSNPNQEGILAEAEQPCEQPKTRVDTTGNSDDADPPSTDDWRHESAVEMPPDDAKALPEERENRPESLTEEEDQSAKTIVKEDDESVAIRKEDDENGEPEQSTSQEEGAKPDSARLLPEASRENKRESRPKAKDDTRRYKIFVIGKTGTGKSTLCNTIVGREVFPPGRSFKMVTTETKEEPTELSGLNVIVVDTPDISDKEESSQKQIMAEWKTSARGHNYMVVLAVRCDQRYSPAEYDVYRQIRDLWGHRDLCRRLVVAFTFADTREDPSVDMTEELKGVWPELQLVMKDAEDRFVLFDNKPGNTDMKAVDTLTDIMEQLPTKDDRRWEWISRAFSTVMFGGFMCVVCGCVIYKVVTKGPRHFCVHLFEMLGRPMRWLWNHIKRRG